MKRLIVVTLVAVFLASCGRPERPAIVVGSKNFTESVILGQLVAEKLAAAGCRVERRLNLGGTFVADTAIRSGEIDAYVEYSGTALTAILHQPIPADRDRVDAIVGEAYRTAGLHWGPGLGFNNTFAMIVRKDDADSLGLHTIADLAKVSDRFQPGFGYEFVERPDGWRGLLKAYDLQFTKTPLTMDLGLTYRALSAGKVDLIAGNSTDGLIVPMHLYVLEDTLHFFPPYHAAIVSREAIEKKCPGARAALDALGGKIDDEAMRTMNYEVDGERRTPRIVAREFLAGIHQGSDI
ncbi:MAG: glycine betaine ABC transporter substrate-binding protein [Thermoanaerobaculia bacterium]